MVVETLFHRYRERTYDPQDEYTLLRYMIVKRAMYDYVKAREDVKKQRERYEEYMYLYPEGKRRPSSVESWMERYKEKVDMIPECEEFFRGDFFEGLAPYLDGETVIKKLRRMKYKELKDLFQREESKT